MYSTPYTYAVCVYVRPCNPCKCSTYTPRGLQVYEGVLHLHNVWTAPLEAVAIIALLLSLTNGIYGLPALGIVVFVLPLQCEHRQGSWPATWAPPPKAFCHTRWGRAHVGVGTQGWMRVNP